MPTLVARQKAEKGKNNDLPQVVEVENLAPLRSHRERDLSYITSEDNSVLKPVPKKRATQR